MNRRPSPSPHHPGRACPCVSTPLRLLITPGLATAPGCPYIPPMIRLTRLVAPLLILLALPATAAEIPLADISAYLNTITTAETTFTQFNTDGTTSKGRLLIRRPNRMRFEYAPPDQTLVLASAGQVAIFDGKSNEPPEQYPLKRTPLNLILAPKVDLTRAKMVVAHGEVDGGLTAVTAQDPDHPDYGQITLYFSADPIALKQWIVTDEGGNTTRVVLGDLKVGNDYPPSTFSITSEIDARKN